MSKHKLLKKLSISIASLALICPLAISGLNNTNVNARRRHVRIHRVYRHYKKTRKARRKSHKRVVHKHARRNHRHNYENILEAEGYNDNYGYKPTSHHESKARWYKNNALRMYNHNINRDHMFRRGFIDSTGGIAPNGNDILTYNNGSGGGNEGEGSIERRYANDSQYKHGWIIGNPLGTYYTIETKGKIRETPKLDYARSLNRWNSGIDYLKADNNAGLIDYSDEDGQWNRDSMDPYATMNHQRNPFY